MGWAAGSEKTDWDLQTLPAALVRTLTDYFPRCPCTDEKTRVKARELLPAEQWVAATC